MSYAVNTSNGEISNNIFFDSGNGGDSFLTTSPTSAVPLQPNPIFRQCAQIPRSMLPGRPNSA